jgi:hypothetical protein
VVNSPGEEARIDELERVLAVDHRHFDLDLAQWIDDLSASIHAINVSKGFWEGGPAAKNKPEALELMHTELTECFDYWRTGSGMPDDKLKHRPGWAVEIADAVIRLLDYAGAYGLMPGTLYTKIRSGESNPVIFLGNFYEGLLELNAEIDMICEHLRKPNKKAHLRAWYSYPAHLDHVLSDHERLVGQLLRSLEWFASQRGVDIWTIVKEKVAFNNGRPYKHGKAF